MLYKYGHILGLEWQRLLTGRLNLSLSGELLNILCDEWISGFIVSALESTTELIPSSSTYRKQGQILFSI